MSEAAARKDQRRTTGFENSQPFSGKRLAPALILDRYLPIGFGPAIERLASAPEHGARLNLRRTCPEKCRIRVIMKNVPLINANAVGDVAQDEMNAGRLQVPHGNNTIGGHD